MLTRRSFIKGVGATVALAILIALTAPCWAAIAYVTGATGKDDLAGSGGTTIATSAWSLGTAHLVVACVKWHTDVTVSSVTDTAGNTYTDAGSGRILIGFGNYLQLWFAYNTTSNASNVVTATFSATADYRLIAATEYSGVKTSATPVDTGATGTSATSTVTSGSFTPSEASTVAAACSGVASGSGELSAGTNYIERVEDGPSAGNDYIHTEDRIDAPASSQTASATSSATRDWAIIVRAFKAAPATTTSPLGSLLGVLP